MGTTSTTREFTGETNGVKYELNLVHETDTDTIEAGPNAVDTSSVADVNFDEVVNDTLRHVDLGVTHGVYHSSAAMDDMDTTPLTRTHEFPFLGHQFTLTLTVWLHASKPNCGCRAHVKTILDNELMATAGRLATAITAEATRMSNQLLADAQDTPDDPFASIGLGRQHLMMLAIGSVRQDTFPSGGSSVFDTTW